MLREKQFTSSLLLISPVFCAFRLDSLRVSASIMGRNISL
jgi:hypothetical protein